MSPSSSTSAWLSSLGRGAYTTMRTVRERTLVFDLTHHLERLSTSLSGLGHSFDRAALFEQVRERTRAALGGAAFPAQSEARITVSVPVEGAHAGEVHVMAEVLPAPAAGPVDVRVVAENRTNAVVKDTLWAMQRPAPGEGFDDILLVDHSTGQVLEGGSSNFFAVTAAGGLQTAKEGVLIGTVRDAVLAIAKEEGLAVEQRPPLLSEAGTAWTGCFLTSTSRGALPIQAIQLENGQRLQMTQFDLPKHLQSRVKQELERRGEKV